MNQTIRFELTAVFATAALLILCSMAYAQNWYFLNRHPAPYGVAHRMATKGAPYGYYWLRSNGNWGAEGDPTVIGNIRDAQPILIEEERWSLRDE